MPENTKAPEHDPLRGLHEMTGIVIEENSAKGSRRAIRVPVQTRASAGPAAAQGGEAVAERSQAPNQGRVHPVVALMVAPRCLNSSGGVR